MEQHGRKTAETGKGTVLGRDCVLYVPGALQDRGQWGECAGAAGSDCRWYRAFLGQFLVHVRAGHCGGICGEKEADVKQFTKKKSNRF